jgi:FtsP/CotA-like multicopper oxidase with cupredoxin domain
VVPLRTTVEEEGLLSYNGMITNAFELLTDVREKLAAQLEAANAKRDFYLAQAELTAAIYGGGSGGSGASKGPAIAAGGGRPLTQNLKGFPMLNRRQLIGAGAAGAALVSSHAWGKTTNMGLPEAAQMDSASTLITSRPNSGPDYTPVVTLNGWTLPHRMNGNVKEFHLVAEPVERELADGMIAHLWGYNGQSTGPTIEAVEGDRVRIYVTNRLPEHTTVHWHGLILPSGMDGVGGLSHPSIPPCKTYVYEFDLTKSGTFMYHPHADEMVQMAMGMMGFFIVHPKDPTFMPVDRDFLIMLNAYDIDPGTYVPRIMTMTDFNLWTWNSRIFPDIDPLVVNRGDKVRVRVTFKAGETVQFTITNDGEAEHEFVMDTMGNNAKHKEMMEKFPEMEHDDPNAVRLQPGEQGTIIWTFANTGAFEFACLIPGHYEAGMHGALTVN